MFIDICKMYVKFNIRIWEDSIETCYISELLCTITKYKCKKALFNYILNSGENHIRIENNNMKKA